MLGTIAQAGGAASPDGGVSYGLLLTLLAVEATLSGLTWAAFNAEARLQKDKDSDLRDAIAGYDSGQVVPAAAELIEAVLQVRRPEEPIQSALDRADTSAALQKVAAAASASARPRDLEQRLVRVWTVAGIATLTAQASGPVLLLNEIADEHLVSHTVQVIAGVILSGGVAVLVVSIIVIRNLTRSLARAITVGKDAASGA